GQETSTEIERVGEEQEGGGLDLDTVKDWAGFVWRGRRRRPKLIIAIFIIVAGLGLTVAFVMPHMYSSQVKLLAQRDLVGPALSNPGLQIPRDADNPTRDVADTIMRRDNLVALVKEANLIERWQATRPWALRQKDRFFEAIYGPGTTDDRLKSLAETLEKRLSVSTNETTVTITVDWQDPQMAYELVTLVEKNFKESRYNADVTVVEDA